MTRPELRTADPGALARAAAAGDAEACRVLADRVEEIAAAWAGLPEAERAAVLAALDSAMERAPLGRIA